MDKEFELCRIKHYHPDGYSKLMTCEDIRKNIDEMKLQFRNKNGTDILLKMGKVDRIYDKFCDELDNFLFQCKCKKN